MMGKLSDELAAEATEAAALEAAVTQAQAATATVQAAFDAYKLAHPPPPPPPAPVPNIIAVRLSADANGQRIDFDTNAPVATYGHDLWTSPPQDPTKRTFDLTFLAAGTIVPIKIAWVDGTIGNYPTKTAGTVPPVVTPPPPATSSVAPGDFPKGTTPVKWNAKPANALAETASAVTHISYIGQEGWANIDRLADVIAKLGVSTIRDQWAEQPLIWNGTFATQMWAHMRVINQRSGADVIYGPLPVDGPFTIERWIQSLGYSMATLVRTGSQDMVYAVEGINEPARGNLGLVGQMMRDPRYKQTIRAALPDTPICAPAMFDARSLADAKAIGDISAVCEYGISHDYPGNDFILTDPIIDAVIAANAAMVGAGKPIIATETGYSNGTRNALHIPSSEADAARRHTVLLAQHHRRGILKSCCYDLMDDSPDGSDDFQGAHGLVAWKAGGGLREKPAFGALQRHIARYRDTHTVPASPPLGVAISGYTPDTRADLHKHSDGRWLLSVWETSNRGGTTKLTVNLDVGMKANAYLPVSGTSTGVGAGLTFDVISREEVTIIEIS